MKNKALIFLAAAMVVLPLFAQQPRRAAQSPAVAAGFKIGDLTKPQASLFRSPTAVIEGVPAPSRSGARKQWAMLEAQYETKADWVDEISFTFHVMTQAKKPQPNQSQFSYFTTEATYRDIAAGKHGAAVVLSGNTLERYGTPVAFAVEVSIGGEQIPIGAAGTEGIGKGTPWWTTLDEIKPIAPTRRQGYLMERSRSPLANSFIDYYEEVK